MSIALTGIAAVLSLASAAPVRAAAPPVCDGAPAAGRLIVRVTGVKSDRGLVAVTIYPDVPGRFLRPHGSLAVVRRPARAPETELCLWVAAPGTYAATAYHDLNANRRFDRGLLGAPAEPYGLSNDPPNLLGIPTFRSVRFAVRAGDTVVRVPLHQPPSLQDLQRARDAGYTPPHDP